VFSYPDASRLLGMAPQFPEPSLALRSFSIDTRTLKPQDLFIAFKGENSDGHEFVAAAFEKGASGALIDEKQTGTVMAAVRKANGTLRNIFPVRDPQAAMTLLAKEYRKTLPVRIAGITGSVGKTTTKEFLYYLLRQKYPVLATSGNLNNHLGVPIMLSRLEKEHRFCVLEMGASHPGEIGYLADLAKPSAGILTPIGPAHLEGFGSLENVYETKLELADALAAGDPLAVPDHNERLLEKLRKRSRKFFTVGPSVQADYRTGDIQVRNGEVSFTVNGKWRYSFPGQAAFLVLNAGLAIAMARSLGVEGEEIPEKWQDVGFASGRFRETILPNGVHVIDDSYNANPVSFENALKAFQTTPVAGKRVVVFADMRELGTDEERFHRELGEKIAVSGIDHALGYGRLARASVEAISGSGTSCVAGHFKGAAEVVAVLKEILRPGDTVLFKGSRSMHVEKVLEGVREISFFAQK